MKKIQKLFLSSFILSLFISCAIQVPPTGGVKDDVAPNILEMTPDNGSKNFDEKKIIIEFDEFIKLNKIRDKLLVSPPLKYDVLTEIKGKKLQIEIQDTLKENTTYLLNFDDAVVDLRENNPIKNLNYVFSTGDKIDSLMLEGQVKNAYSRELVEGMTIGLYKKKESDSIPYKFLPNYIAKTNKDGKFQLKNLAAGEYLIFGLKDENRNYLFDRPDEMIAFESQWIVISTQNDTLELNAFIEDHEKQYLKSQEEKGPYSKLIFNLPVDSLSIDLINGEINNELILKLSNLTNDTINLWWKEQDGKRWELDIRFDTLRDTIKVKVDSIKRKKENYLRPKLSSQLDFFSKLQLEFQYPLLDVDTSLIKILSEDSLELNYSILKKEDLKSVIIDFEVEQSKFYLIQIMPNAFQDVYSIKNDSIFRKIGANESKDFGNLFLTLELNDSTPKVLQLLSSNDKVIKEIQVSDSIAEFKNLRSGNYKLRMIYDSNGDGVWTTGNYLQNSQAERIVFFEEGVSIRSNWDKDIKWVIEEY